MKVTTGRVNGKWLDLEYQEVEIGDHRLRYAVSGPSSVKRVASLLTKEPITIAWMETFAEGETMYDIGANVGTYTVYAAIKRKARVYAFEPEALNYAELNKNIFLNDLHGQVLGYCVALSDVDKADRLLLSDFGYGISYHDFQENSWATDMQFAPDWFVRKDERRPQGAIGRRLDSLIGEGLPVPAHIKIDVDGLEHRVVAGMIALLRRAEVRTVLIEVNFSDPRNLALIDRLGELGWRFSWKQLRCHRKVKFTVEQIQRYQEKGQGGLNYIFYRDPFYDQFFDDYFESYVPPLSQELASDLAPIVPAHPPPTDSAVPASPGRLELRPASEMKDRGGQRWVAVQGPIRFEVRLDDQLQGWHFLTTRVSRTILDGSARLLAETDRGEVRIEVPVAAGGHVYELVNIPAGTQRLYWQPSGLVGPFEQAPLAMRPVGILEKNLLMARRVIGYLLKQSKQAKQRVGLSAWRSLVDLPGQYRACGRLRNCAYKMPYADWISQFDVVSADDRKSILNQLEKMGTGPHFVVVVHGDGEAAVKTVESVEGQLYPHRSIQRADEAISPAQYVLVLQAGDLLAPHALYWMAERILSEKNVGMLYADEDLVDAGGRRSEPKFKPDWSPEHLRSINYVGRGAVIRGAELAAAGGLSPRFLAGDGHELNLRVAAGLGEAAVEHVPAVLYHRSVANATSPPVPRARYPLPAARPLVSIVIPTRDRERLLQHCIDSVERASTYRDFEILVVDNQSTDIATIDYLASLKHRVLRYDHAFNYSAINNLGVREARGDVIVLLNNDVEVISPDWLEEMLGHLHRPGVGVVGAKLLFPDGTVQHAGDAVGPGGCADHMHGGIARDAPGYCHRAVVAHEVSAVTGACLMTWKTLYQRLGGLDEQHLPVSFNDVDYCLRVQRAGQRVVFTPHAQLYHHESASRGRDMSAEQIAREARELKVIRRRWRERLEHDPYYNPNLSYRFPDFTLSDEPRVRKPWLR